MWIRLERVLSVSEAEALGKRIQESLARRKSKLMLDFKNLRWDKADNPAPLGKKLAASRSRIRSVLPKLSQAHS